MPDRATSAITLPAHLSGFLNLFKPEAIPSEGVTKSISAPLDRKATRQLQSHWIRNQHQSLTGSNENTIFHDSHAKYRCGYCTSCENSRKTVAKGSSHHIVKLHPIENLLGSFYFAWPKTLLSSLPLRRRSRSSHLSLSHT
jgi:hypothetical protein